MFYYLSENNTEGTNAGNKARNDAEKILETRNSVEIPLQHLEKSYLMEIDCYFLLKINCTGIK